MSLQYHFAPEAFLNPYVGLGVNWTLFYSEKIAPVLADGLRLDDSLGLAGQIGADLRFGDRWLVNFDVRYIDISTKARIKVEGQWLPLGDVAIDPFVSSLMVGCTF